MYKEKLAFNYPSLNKTVNELIIVPGHALLKDSVSEIPQNIDDDKWWVLQSFQAREPKFYIEHINAGLNLASKEKYSLLIFSGGFSREESKVWSEAATYGAIAKSKCQNCSENQCDVPERIILDESSYDSKQNIENSLKIYEEIVGRYPEHITVIGWEFKRERFEFYRDILKIPKDIYTYCGVNNPENLGAAMKGEKKTIELLRNFDSTGELANKRVARNYRGNDKILWHFSKTNRTNLDIFTN